MIHDIEQMQCQADAEYYLRSGYPVTDEAIEQFYRNQSTASYDFNQFLDAVYEIYDEISSNGKE